MAQTSPDARLEDALISFAISHSGIGGPIADSLVAMITGFTEMPTGEAGASPAHLAASCATSWYELLREEAGLNACIAELAAVVSASGLASVPLDHAVGPISVGLEVAVRITDLIDAGTTRGMWSAAGTAAVLGGTVAAATARRASRQLGAAIGLGAAQAAALDVGGDTFLARRAAWSAAAANDAVSASLHGITGPRFPITGTAGLLTVIQCVADPRLALDELGSDWRSASVLAPANQCRWHDTRCGQKGEKQW